MYIVHGTTWWLQIYRIVRNLHPIINSETVGAWDTYVLRYGVYRTGNDFELIPTMKIETRHPIEIYFGREFPAVIIAELWQPEVARIGKFSRTFCVFLEKRPLMIKFSKFCSEGLHRDTDRRCCVQNWWKSSNGKSVKACIIYLTKKTFFWLPLKLWLLRGSRPKSAMASPQHLADNFPNFIQIGSLSAEL